MNAVPPDPPPSLPFADFSFVVPDELEPNQRWSSWDDIGVLAGPEPRPDWVITDSAAIDTELGILKSGKEADVFLLERATTERSSVLAAKRYRSAEHRQFHRDNSYLDGRKTRNSRDRRALATKGSAHGRAVKAGQWAQAEFGYLADFWSAGLPVPYPIQLNGTEILMEFITLPDSTGAPRLAQSRPDSRLLRAYWDQLRAAVLAMAGRGLAHGDLSAFNVLATADRVVIIDLPQAVDIVSHPQGMDFLARDCRNLAGWFSSRGLDVDADALLAEAIGQAW